MDPTLEPIKSWMGPCGALMVSAFVPNCTQVVDGVTASFYKSPMGQNTNLD